MTFISKGQRKFNYVFLAKDTVKGNSNKTNQEDHFNHKFFDESRTHHIFLSIHTLAMTTQSYPLDNKI